MRNRNRGLEVLQRSYRHKTIHSDDTICFDFSTEKPLTRELGGRVKFFMTEIVAEGYREKIVVKLAKKDESHFPGVDAAMAEFGYIAETSK